MLHPLLKSISEQAEEIAAPPLRTLSPKQARARIATMKRSQPVESAGVAVSADVISDVPVRWYVPDNARATPVVVYLHSGGWVLGDLEAPDPMLRLLARRSGLRYVSVDYRLAPEYPFPSALEDAQTVINSIVNTGHRFLVHGDSAGGNLAAVISARYRNDTTMLGQVLVYPVTDCDTNRESYHRDDLPPGFLEPEDMRWFWGLYAPEGERTNPELSPLRGDLKQTAPTLIITAEFDPLRDEGIAYARLAEFQGVDVQHWHAVDCTHGFMQMTGTLDRADEYTEKIALALRDLVRRSRSCNASDKISRETPLT